MSEVTVYGATFSPFVRKAVVVGLEKGIDVQSVPVSPRDIPDELKPHSPLSKIPFANVKGQWVADSSVICELIDELWPEPAFYPADPFERARARWIEEYVDGGLVPNVGPKIVGQRIVRPLFMNEPCDEAVVQDAIDNIMPRYVSYLDAQLEGRDWFVGDSITIADIAVASALATLRHAEVELDAGTYPNLVRHGEAMFARPSLAKLLEGEAAFLVQLKQQLAAATA